MTYYLKPYLSPNISLIHCETFASVQKCIAMVRPRFPFDTIVRLMCFRFRLCHYTILQRLVDLWYLASSTDCHHNHDIGMQKSIKETNIVVNNIFQQNLFPHGTASHNSFKKINRTSPLTFFLLPDPHPTTHSYNTPYGF